MTLKWSFNLLNYKRVFSIGVQVSLRSSVQTEVPHGSILGPILCSLYLLPLDNIILYADNTQPYVLVKPESPTSLSAIKDNVTDILNWIPDNYLPLNSDIWNS